MLASDDTLNGSGSSNSMLQLLGSLVDTLQRDPADIASARHQIEPIIDEIKENLAQSTHETEAASTDPKYLRMPKPETMLSFVNTIKLFLFRSNNSSISPDQVKSRMLNAMAQIVLDLTHADCVLVRKLLTDSSAELMGEPVFASGNERGFPPKIKHASRELFMRPDHRPTVVPDLSKAAADSALLKALGLNLERWPDDSPEHQFLSAISAEICIPLVVHGEVPAGVVAARWTPYDIPSAKKIEESLLAWQPILTYFYHHALPGSTSIHEISRSLPILKERGTDWEFLHGVATILTSHCGLGWHRAFVYILDETDAPDAHCVMALGGDGLPNWSIKQNEISNAYGTLSELLMKEETLEEEEDALHKLVRENSELLNIYSAEMTSNQELMSILSVDFERNPGYRDGNSSLTVQADDPWFKSLQVADVAFRHDASKCEHIIIPMFSYHPFKPIGFYLLDNPYVHPVGIIPDLTITKFVCNYLTDLMIGRSIGLNDWYKNSIACHEVVSLTLNRLVNEPELLRQYSERRHAGEESLCHPLRS